jgi:DNA-binding NtrC family response regulator
LFPGSAGSDVDPGFLLRHDFFKKHFHEVSFEIAMNANILVIDDEESIRFTFYKFLAEKGNHVCTSRNLLESLSKMKETVYDLIIVDIILSDGCGLDVLKKIDRNEVETQVIIMTAYPTMETIDMSFKMHAADYIIKPIRQSELISSVTNIIQKKISLRKKNVKNDEIFV